ncbi:hypothetical protein SAMN05421813_103114 [Daejeonella rubra]|uniref:Uncharacterized protein n=1 Tax=Daejeonella rubra TaxID=990371 RepID=A0A1G9NNC2_9SPHI|nr:hypothetical protein SAMN05421813_103114 [Daejeonella rubra]
MLKLTITNSRNYETLSLDDYRMRYSFTAHFFCAGAGPWFRHFAVHFYHLYVCLPLIDAYAFSRQSQPKATEFRNY